MYSLVKVLDAQRVNRFTIGGWPENLPGSIGEPEKQVGYEVPPRNGLVWFYSPTNSDEIREVRAQLTGYNGHVVEVQLPARVTIELPCQVLLLGEDGVEVAVAAWVADPAGERGGAFGVTGAGPHAVPLWAKTVDVQSTLIEFFDAAAVSLGQFSGSFVGLSIPPRAATMNLAAATNGAIFRQG